ncbi:hypothetical protein Ancab_036020 [Ancistrocladus abbreviatus]
MSGLVNKLPYKSQGAYREVARWSRPVPYHDKLEELYWQGRAIEEHDNAAVGIETRYRNSTLYGENPVYIIDGVDKRDFP